MILRIDHIAGGIFIILGVLVFALSGPLPFGTLSFPGAGFVPKLIASLMIVLGAALALQGHASARLKQVDWSDLWHAGLIMLMAAGAAMLYTRAGFVITIALLLLGIVLVIERKSWLWAVIFSASVTGLAYGLFVFLLKSPLPRGPFGF